MAWMVYLNDVEEGGETEFLYQKLKVKPKKGKKKEKRVHGESSFQQRDGFVFRASLSYSLFRRRTRGQRRLYLGRRVSLF